MPETSSEVPGATAIPTQSAHSRSFLIPQNGNEFPVSISEPTTKPLVWLNGGGEMRERIRSLDWSRHPLGPPEQWPPEFTTALDICLSSRFPIILWWGSELRVLYNDAYTPILGEKHPTVLGKTGVEAWGEVWDVIGPMLRRVLEQGEATWSEDQMLPLQRFGYVEEAYFTWSYSPIHSGGGVGGVFSAVFETTTRVLGQRRLVTLRELGANATVARSVEEACDRFGQTLEQNPADVPFALVYLLDPASKRLELRRAVRVPQTHPASLSKLALENAGPNSWPVAECLERRSAALVGDLVERFGPFSGGQWPETPRAAMILPIPGADPEHALGVLILGVNPRRALDDEYTGFMELVAGQFATAVSNAQSYEKERQRAEALAELDRAKTAFFSNVSHEFRTPLTLMLGPMEELLEAKDTLSAHDAHGLLETAHRNSLRLLKLVNTMLDFSRIEAGRVQAHYEPLDLSEYTAGLASAFRSAMERAKLCFEVECPPLPAPVYVDRDMWEKIVFNLLSNAFKFTFNGGVRVDLRAEAAHAVLTVSDTGTGIPEAELPNLFKRFHRVQNARARTHEGTGIGLALVLELVKLHGGTIVAHSEPDVGTRFQVRLPFGSSHLPMECLGPSRPEESTRVQGEAFVEEVLRWMSPESVETFGPHPELPPSPSAGPLPCVLVADDNADMRDYIQRLLRNRFQVQLASDGATALEMARHSRPDLILSDIMMPALDGFGLLAAIRKDPDLRLTPVILLSARAGGESRLEGLQHGADDYLVKPFSARELLARLETHLALSRTREDARTRERLMRQEAEHAREQLDKVLSSIDEQFIILDQEWRYAYVNDRVLEKTGLTREELLGHNMWDLFPATTLGDFYRIVQQSVAERRPARFEFFYEPWGRWFDNRVYPVPEGLAILATDITERKQIEAALRKTQDELLRINRELEERVNQRTASLREAIAQMEEFSYSVSHDLRSPVRAMLGYATALMEDQGNKLDLTGKGYLWRIIQSAGRMERLIHDVLTYSRLSRETFTPTPISLQNLLRDLVWQYPEFQPERARVIVVSPLPKVLGHEPSLTQAITNLLGNAVKFVPPGVFPEVRVRGEHRGGMVRLWFEDNGIGIKPEHQKRLFGLFERIHPKSAYDGTGIGLAIVRKSVERMGGKVGVQSDGANGSQFWIELPAA